MYNKKKLIIDILSEISYIYKIKNDTFRFKAYRNAIGTIERINEPIYFSEQLKGIPLIGKKIYEKIVEIINTGKSKKLDELKQDPNIKIIWQLKRLVGFSSKMADILINKYNIKNIRDISKLNLKLTSAQILSLKYYKDILKDINRNDAKKLCHYIYNISYKIDKNISIVLAGSYRRGSKNSKDIDIIITNIKTPDFMDILISKLKLSGIYSLGKTKLMGLLKDNNGIVRHVDINLVLKENFWPALMHFTGSGTFNQYIRSEFKKKGWKLSEYGLFDNKGKKKIIRSENDIFKYIGMEYVPPNKRN